MARYEDLPYRTCVGMMLINAAGLVFIGRRAGGIEHVDDTHVWQMPQGGVDPGEDTWEAAKRELYEETSVRSVEKLGEVADWLIYDIPRTVAGRAWKGRYRGQRQKWFAMRFTGKDAEINVASPGGGHKAEFVSWRWEPMKNLPDLIVPFKRPVYERVVKEFARLAGDADRAIVTRQALSPQCRDRAVQRRGHVLIGRRFRDDGPEIILPGLEWQMPQGGIDAGEDPREAVMRELWEETGAISADYLGETDWMTYEFPPYDGPPSHRLAKFRGQRQKWFALRFTGHDDEIDPLTPRNGQPAEFDSWRWERLDRVADLVVPFRREVYRAVAVQFAEFAR